MVNHPSLPVRCNRSTGRRIFARCAADESHPMVVDGPPARVARRVRGTGSRKFQAGNEGGRGAAGWTGFGPQRSRRFVVFNMGVNWIICMLFYDLRCGKILGSDRPNYTGKSRKIWKMDPENTPFQMFPAQKSLSKKATPQTPGTKSTKRLLLE